MTNKEADYSVTSAQLSAIGRDNDHFAHAVFNDDDGRTIVSIATKPLPNTKTQDGGSLFFLDATSGSFGFRWQDKAEKSRFIRYAGTSDWTAKQRDFVLNNVIAAAKQQFALSTTRTSPVGHLSKKAIVDLTARADVIGLSAASIDEPAGVAHLVWLEPSSNWGRRVGKDRDGDRLVQLQLYPECFGVRWLTPASTLETLIITGDENTIATVQAEMLANLPALIDDILSTLPPTI